MSDASDWQELIDRHLRGELDEAEKERLAKLLDSDPAARRDFVEQAQWDTRLTEVLRASGDRRGSFPNANVENDLEALFAERAVTRRERAPTLPLSRALLAVAVLIIVALTVSLYYQQPSAQQPIATITGLSGSLQWTGDGGRVFYDLAVERELPGGTIEGMTPGSWFELAFNDGSTITISGNSTLTFSDRGQKELHLKECKACGDVRRQPAGKPMLVHTRSAILQVLGTQFEVDAGLSETTLNVSKGRVQVQRLSDGSKVVVPAKHRVIVAADRALLVAPTPDAASQWKSQLHLGPEGTLGKWLPGTNGQAARLRAVPYTTRLGHTIYTASFEVSWGDQPPVILGQGSRLRVCGSLESAHEMYFGVTVRHPNGEFAGNFQATKPAEAFQAGHDFELTLALGELRLDPSLLQIKDKLPSDPYGLVVESFWCHTLSNPAGLAIAEVELIPPTQDRS